MSDSHLLRIIHRTHYQYATPVSFEAHRLVIRPREGHDLRVEQLNLSISPSADVTWARDIFGNSIAYAHFREPSAELKFNVDVVVRRFFSPDAPPRKTHSPSLYPVEYDFLEQAILKVYMTPVFAEDTEAMHSGSERFRTPEIFRAQRILCYTWRKQSTKRSVMSAASRKACKLREQPCHSAADLAGTWRH